MRVLLLAALAVSLVATESQALHTFGYNPYGMQNNINNAYRNTCGAQTTVAVISPVGGRIAALTAMAPAVAVAYG